MVDTAARKTEDRFLRACRREPVDHVPVWFMRQAGRSLPEYNAIRERHSLLDICKLPELAAEVTLQPVKRLGVDAAILFSDIVVPLLAAGIELEIREGVGPVIDRPLRDERDLDRLRPLDPGAHVPYVLETIEYLVRELPVPLIGFAGAPFTLACYLIEGGPSKHYARTRALMRGAPEVWSKLMERLTASTTSYLRAQIASGAAAVQLFDSWIGALAPEDFRVHVLPYVRQVFDDLSDLGAPGIYFGVGTGELLGLMALSGAEVVGVDWRVPLDEARARTAPGVALQGNLDPSVCLAPWHVVERESLDVLARGGGRGHVFNLGHGVLPETDPDVLARIVELVHAWEPAEGE